MEYLIRKSIGLSIAFLLLLVGSCGGGGNSSTVGLTPANPDSVLVGFWENAGCELLVGASSNDFVVYNPDGSFQFTVRAYGNSNCTDLLYTATRFSSFVEGSDIMLDDGRIATELNYGPETNIQVTPQSDAGASLLNSLDACEISDWELGVSRNALGCETGVGNIEFIAMPANFEIYELIDNHFLYFGTELSFTATNRPTQLRSSPTFIKRQTADEGFPAAVGGFWQVEAQEIYFQMRPNSVIYSYSLSASDASCFDQNAITMLRLADNTYFDFMDTTYRLQPTLSGLDFTITFVGDAPNLLTLVRNNAIGVTDLVLCGS